VSLPLSEPALSSFLARLWRQDFGQDQGQPFSGARPSLQEEVLQPAETSTVESWSLELALWMHERPNEE
jgi:hypothetical protein